MFRSLFGLAVCGVFTLSAAAAPVPVVKSGDGTGPQFVGQALAIDRAMELFRSGAKRFAPKSMCDMMDEAIRQFPSKEPLDVVDFTKPFGFYGRVEDKLVNQLEELADHKIQDNDIDLTNLRLVFLVPIKPEKLLLKLLKPSEGMSITPVQGKPGIYAVRSISHVVESVPGMPPKEKREPVGPTAFLKVHKNYVYIALFSMEPLEGVQLLDPAEVIDAKDTDSALLRFYPERLPRAFLPALRKQMEKGDALIDMGGAAPLTFRTGVKQLLNMSRRWVDLLFLESRMITLHFSADAPNGLVFSRITVEPKPGSPLAGMFKDIPATVTNSFGSLVGPESVAYVAQSFHLNVPDFRQGLAKMLDGAKEEASKNLIRQGEPQEVQDLAAEALDGVSRTLLGGQLDLAIDFRGPNKTGHYVGVMAVTYKGARKVEKALKKAIPTIPEEVGKRFKFDAGKIGNLTYHEIDVDEFLKDSPTQNLFGKSPKWLVAFAEDAVYVAFGDDALARLAEAINAKPAVLPMAVIKVHGKRLVDVVRTAVGAEAIQEQKVFVELANLIASHEWLTWQKVDITGGAKLTIASEVNIGLQMLPAVLSGREAQKAPQAVPAPNVAPAAPERPKMAENKEKGPAKQP